jgi:transposase
VERALPNWRGLWCKSAFSRALRSASKSLAAVCGRRDCMATTAITTFAASTLAAKRRSLERRLAAILGAPTTCDLARDIQSKFRRAREQLLTFVAFPGAVDVTNNACERALRPAVVQRKVTNGYRAMWAAEGEAAVRTVVDTARLGPGALPFCTILKTVAA